MFDIKCLQGTTFVVLYNMLQWKSGYRLYNTYMYIYISIFLQKEK